MTLTAKNYVRDRRDFATPKFARPEIEARYKNDMFFRVAVDVGYKHNLYPWIMLCLQHVLPMVKLEGQTPEQREEELRAEAEAMVKEYVGKVGVTYSLPSANGI